MQEICECVGKWQVYAADAVSLLDDGMTTCSDCRMRKNIQIKQNKERKRIENKMSKDKKSSQEIDRINAMAKEKGLSYGIFVALQGNI